MADLDNELRRHPILPYGVIVAKNRAKRPTDFIQKKPAPSQEGVCFFCPGNEHLTPPEISRVPDASGKSWKIRVFPNKFNATALSFPKAYGTHEVIVETSEHEKTLSDLPVDHIVRLLQVYQERIASLRRNKRIKYVSIFKNEGKEAGASLSHTHTQLISLDATPPKIEQEIALNKAFSRKHGQCFFCSSEESEKKRVVFKDENFFAFCPFASRFHFETWFAPRRHAGQLTDLDEGELFSLAKALKSVIGRLDSKLGRPPYNFHLHAAPLSGDKSFHLHIQLTPRFSTWAGFEFGTGLYINSLPPEEAAAMLRE